MQRNWGIVLWVGALLLSSVAGASRPPLAPAALTFTVNNGFDVPANFTGDPGFTACQTSPGNNICTLRAAIMNANRHPGGATIILPSETYVLSVPPMGPDDDATGDLNITGTVSLLGSGAASTIVDGAGLDDVFSTDSHSVVTISGLTVRHGDNGGTGSGGGIDNFGQLTLSDSTVTDNRAGLGGGIYNEQGATLLVRRSTIRDNRAVLNSGGGVESQGQFTLENSTVSANQAVVGGGISTRNSGSLTVVNSTISNNSATGTGGGVFAGSPAVFYHTTVAGNLADSNAAQNGYGGGIYASVSGQAHIWNTLVAYNYLSSTVSDCGGAGLTSNDYNDYQPSADCAIALTSGATHDVLGGEILLAGLAANGGSTLTRALLQDSPALDQIPPARCRDQFGVAPVPDQRGVARPVNGLCDIGAFEGAQGLPYYFSNLIQNGDAEAAAGSLTGAFVGAPFWSVSSGQFTVVPYGSPGGFPVAGVDRVPSNHGENLFAGGHATPSSAIQYIGLAGIAGAVDAGGVHLTLAGDLGGWTTDADNAQVEVDFLNAGSGTIGSPVTIGPVTPAERGFETGLVNQSATALVPAGARLLRVTVSMTAFSGYNDGYADNLSLVLTPAHALFLPLARR
jgi:hypothetical protein